MRTFFAFASVGSLLFSVYPAAADCTECKQIECSGRQIDCGHEDPISKVKCEADKELWKLNCEAKKAACQGVER